MRLVKNVPTSVNPILLLMAAAGVQVVNVEMEIIIGPIQWITLLLAAVGVQVVLLKVAHVGMSIQRRHHK